MQGDYQRAADALTALGRESDQLSPAGRRQLAEALAAGPGGSRPLSPDLADRARACRPGAEWTRLSPHRAGAQRPGERRRRGRAGRHAAGRPGHAGRGAGRAGRRPRRGAGRARRDGRGRRWPGADRGKVRPGRPTGSMPGAAPATDAPRPAPLAPPCPWTTYRAWRARPVPCHPIPTRRACSRLSASGPRRRRAGGVQRAAHGDGRDHPCRRSAAKSSAATSATMVGAESGMTSERWRSPTPALPGPAHVPQPGPRPW